MILSAAMAKKPIRTNVAASCWAELKMTGRESSRQSCAPATPAPIPPTTATTSIVGFYHSHPDHPARWSSTDLAGAHWIGCSYVITSVEKGKAAVTNSFELTGTDESDKRLQDETVEVS